MAYFENPQPVEPIMVIERVARGKRELRWLQEIRLCQNVPEEGWAPVHVALLPCGKRSYELISLSTWPLDGAGF